MSVKSLKFTSAAQADLIDIYAYTQTTWGSRQADAYIDDLELACARIADGSAITRILEFRGDGMFKTRQGRHLVISQISDTDVLIVRVLHESMDAEARLDER